MDTNQLEEEYKVLLGSLHNKVRENWAHGWLSAADADKLHAMINDRLGVSDPNTDGERAWENSSWCGDTAWQDSGCVY